MDNNIKILEKEFDVIISNRNNEIKIKGDSDDIEKAYKTILYILKIIENGDIIDENTVKYYSCMVKEAAIEDMKDIKNSYAYVTFDGTPIKGKTISQQKYINDIRKKTVVFGVGPAGTGKTYLAVAMAVSAFKSGLVKKILLTRPAVEAGEKLGFLPGDLQDKVDPYLRPLYDSLYEFLGSESFEKNLERGNIEVAPLAFMRGRTLNDSFIILDEAQNTTKEQMKMFLTRIGNNSKVVVTGDITQIDIPDKLSSGLIDAIKVLSNSNDISIRYFNSIDVVRNVIVQNIINAYDDFYGKDDKDE